MNILVIGGTRFIGAHTVARLAEAGHTVTVFHRGKHNADLVPDSVEHIHAIDWIWALSANSSCR